MAVSSLRIGIEIEVLLCAIKIQDQCKFSIEDFADALVQHYNTRVGETSGQTKMRTAFDTLHASDDPENFGYWAVNDDATIVQSSTNWGLEFASPILRYESGSLWRQNLQLHFEIIESYAYIISDITCGTHVHVSPGDSTFTLEQVKNVARSIIYFEEVFEVLLPPERCGNRVCRSNRFHNPKLRHLSDLDACFQKIEECAKMRALLLLMNAREPNAIAEYESDGEKCVVQPFYGFNFENLMEGKIGTIEFRRPPCVTRYQDCVMWVEFGASFMQAAMQYGSSPGDLRAYGADVAGLARFVRRATIPGMNDQGILDQMFARGTGSSPVGPLKRLVS